MVLGEVALKLRRSKKSNTLDIVIARGKSDLLLCARGSLESKGEESKVRSLWKLCLLNRPRLMSQLANGTFNKLRRLPRRCTPADAPRRPAAALPPRCWRSRARRAERRARARAAAAPRPPARPAAPRRPRRGSRARKASSRRRCLRRVLSKVGEPRSPERVATGRARTAHRRLWHRDWWQEPATGHRAFAQDARLR